MTSWEFSFEIDDIHNSWLYYFTNPLGLGTHVRTISRMCDGKSETRVPSSRGFVKQYNRVVYIFKFKMFHQEASLETIKMNSLLCLVKIPL